MVYVYCFIAVLLLSFAATYRLSDSEPRGQFNGRWAERKFLLRKTVLVWPLQTLILTTIIGFRFDVGTDWYGYVSIYNGLYDFDFSRMQLALFKGFEPGYVALNIASNKLGFSYYGIFLVSALLTYGFLFFALARDAENHVIAIVALFGLGFIFWHTNHVRQAIAASIVFWSVRFLWERRLFTYFISISVATLFHYTAIVLLPLGLLARVRYTKSVIYASALIAFIFPFFGDAIQSIVMQSLPQFAPETYMSILESQADKELQGSGLHRALQFLPPIVLIFLIRISSDRDEKLNVLMNFTIFYLLLAALFSGIHGLFRIAIYFKLISILFISCATIARLGEGRALMYRKFVIVICIFSFGFSLAVGSHSAVPYKSTVLGL